MIWLKTSEVSELLGISEQGVRKKTDAYINKYVKGRGGTGKKILIALESLPKYAQDKYHGIKPESDFITSKVYTGKQKDKASFKMRIVQLYTYSGLKVKDFVDEFNEKNPEDKISTQQLYLWLRKLRNSNFDICSLIDTRGKYNKGACSIPQQAWEYFYALYMNESKPSMQRCYDLTLRTYENIPSLKTFSRKLKTIPELVFIRYREGEKAFNDSLPSMIRSRLDIKSNDIWFSDHHLMDVAVTNKYGKVVRPWLTVFYDARSNKVISYILRDKSADSDVIKQCLKKGIINNGIPKELYFDNGKDYREKSFDKNFSAALVNKLGIQMIYATPYHGQAKTVERWFRTLEERFCKFFPTYLGRDAKQRPEKMKKTFKQIEKEGLAPDIKVFEEKLALYIDEYNDTPSKGRDMEKKPPNQVYIENLENKLELRDFKELDIICGSYDTRTVGKNGISYEGRTYYSQELLKYYKQKVYINYSPDNLDELHIFTMDMKYICLAKTKLVTAFRHTTKEDIREAKKEQKKARKLVETYLPTRELETMEIVANNQAIEKANESQVTKSENPSSKKNKTKHLDTEGNIKNFEKERERNSIIVNSYMNKIGGF